MRASCHLPLTRGDTLIFSGAMSWKLTAVKEAPEASLRAIRACPLSPLLPNHLTKCFTDTQDLQIRRVSVRLSQCFQKRRWHFLGNPPKFTFCVCVCILFGLKMPGSEEDILSLNYRHLKMPLEFCILPNQMFTSFRKLKQGFHSCLLWAKWLNRNSLSSVPKSDQRSSEERRNCFMIFNPLPPVLSDVIGSVLCFGSHGSLRWGFILTSFSPFGAPWLPSIYNSCPQLQTSVLCSSL